MGLTDAILAADTDAIFDDLAGTSAVETVERIPTGATAVTNSFDVLRAKQRTAEELLNTGFETQYRFSFYARRANIGETEEGDIIVMANGDRVRVHRMEEQPARVNVMFDVGDENEDGEDISG